MSNDGTTEIITVYQGSHHVSDQPNACLVTVLGSCVATCLYDPERSVGGLNHFLLAQRPGNCDGHQRYGINSMELLINGLLSRGAKRHRLQAKLFGGASMLGDLGDIGRVNAEFAKQYLRDEGIPLISESLLGNKARRIRFWPATGRAQQLCVERTELASVKKTLPHKRTTADDVELF